MRIEERIKELREQMDEMSIQVAEEYNGMTYICDAIQEVADSNVSIYYNDIIEFISENVELVNDAIAEYGWDGCGSDLYKAGQMAECLQNEQIMYDELDLIIELYALEHLQNLGYESIAEDAEEAIYIELGAIDHNLTFECIIEAIDAVCAIPEEV